MPNLQRFTLLSVGSTEVEGCLPFCHEVDPAMSFWCVRDNFGLHSGGPELALLRTTPPIGMGQDKLNVGRYRMPAELPKFVGVKEERFGRVEEIAHKVREDIDDCFTLRKFFAHLILQRRRRFRRPEHELPPVTVSNREQGDLGVRTIASEEGSCPPAVQCRSQHPESYRFGRSTRWKGFSLILHPGCRGTCLQFVSCETAEWGGLTS